MVNKSEVLSSAWADYRRDSRMGRIAGQGRKGPFSRRHFAYCLRMAWQVAKERAAKAAVQKAQEEVAARAVVSFRIPSVREVELQQQLWFIECAERMDFTAYSSLSAELAQLSTAA